MEELPNKGEITGLSNPVFPPVEDSKVIKLSNKSDVNADRYIRRKTQREQDSIIAKFREIRKRFDSIMVEINWDEVSDELFEKYIQTFSQHWTQFANTWNGRKKNILIVNERAMYDYAKNQDLPIEW